MMKRFRNIMLTGLLALLPVYLTVIVLVWVLQTTDNFFLPIFERFFQFKMPGLGVLATVVIVFLAGAVLSNVYGAFVLGWVDSLLERLPIFKGLYRNIKRIIESLNPNNPSGFKEFVFVENPSGDGYTAGFLTGQFTLARPDGTPQDLAAVFIPSNHLYLGAIHIVDRRRIIRLAQTLQDGASFALSAGASFKGEIKRAPPQDSAP